MLNSRRTKGCWWANSEHHGDLVRVVSLQREKGRLGGWRRTRFCGLRKTRERLTNWVISSGLCLIARRC